MKRERKHGNVRFLESRPTGKPIPPIAVRRRLKKLQRQARQVQRRIQRES